MHQDQLQIDPETAATMIREQFPQFRDHVVLRLRGLGTDHAIFRIGAGFTARFPLRTTDPDISHARLHAEAMAMTEFAQQAPFPTPRPVGIGRPSPHYPMPWSVQTWIDGMVATPDGHAASSVLAGDLAKLIGALRAADTQGRRFDGEGRGGALPDHDAWIETCLKQSTDLLDVVRLGEIWARLRALPPAGPEVMSHRDLIPANLLVQDERLVGVLDAGRYGPADPALDLVGAWHLFDHERRETVRQTLGSSDVEWQRGKAWAFQQAIGLVWYYAESNPGMAALGRSTLQRLLDDTEI